MWHSSIHEGHRHHRPPQRPKEQFRNRCSIPQSSSQSSRHIVTLSLSVLHVSKARTDSTTRSASASCTSVCAISCTPSNLVDVEPRFRSARPGTHGVDQPKTPLHGSLKLCTTFDRIDALRHCIERQGGTGVWLEVREEQKGTAPPRCSVSLENLVSQSDQRELHGTSCIQ